MNERTLHFQAQLYPSVAVRKPKPDPSTSIITKHFQKRRHRLCFIETTAVIPKGNALLDIHFLPEAVYQMPLLIPEVTTDESGVWIEISQLAIMDT